MKVNKITIYAEVGLSPLISYFQNKIEKSDYKSVIKIVPMGTNSFNVVINKVGTSTLVFRSIGEKEENKCVVELYKSDISFLHKSHIQDVLNYIENAVNDLGGYVTSE